MYKLLKKAITLFIIKNCEKVNNIKKRIKKLILFSWLRGHDSNVRPPGYEPDELPTALPRVIVVQIYNYYLNFQIISKKYLFSYFY